MPASIINLNATVPAAPSGEQNVQWQKGATTGNDPTYGYPVFPASANIPNTGGAVVKTANYTATTGDCGRLLSFNSASAVTLTLPAAAPVLPAGAAPSQWQIDVENIGAGVLTVSRNGLLIDTAAADLTLTQNQGAGIATDGTNYFTRRGVGSLSLTTTGSSGAATLSAGVLNVPIYAGGPFDVICSLVGAPTTGQLVFLMTFVRTVNFAGNFTGSAGTVGTNPTATATYTVARNGTSIGTAVVSTGGVVTFTTTSGATESFSSGDILTVTAPSPADATLANAAFTFAGTR
jgi:hypothetical protein